MVSDGRAGAAQEEREGERGEGAPAALPESFITVDVLDEESGMAEVEDERGRSFELPASWLPAAAEGAAYAVQIGPDGVRFQPFAAGARALRERSKQTLLDFSDEHGDGEHGDGEHGDDEHVDGGRGGTGRGGREPGGAA